MNVFRLKVKNKRKFSENIRAIQSGIHGDTVKMMPPVRDDQDSSMDSRGSFMIGGKSTMDLNHLHQQSHSHDQLNQLHQPSGSPSSIPNHIGLSKAELRKVRSVNNQSIVHYYYYFFFR